MGRRAASYRRRRVERHVGRALVPDLVDSFTGMREVGRGGFRRGPPRCAQRGATWQAVRDRLALARRRRAARTDHERWTVRRRRRSARRGRRSGRLPRRSGRLPRRAGRLPRPAGRIPRPAGRLPTPDGHAPTRARIIVRAHHAVPERRPRHPNQRQLARARPPHGLDPVPRPAGAAAGQGRQARRTAGPAPAHSF